MGSQNTNAPTFIDLFCGCGGLALGFEQAGFRSVYAVDEEDYCCETYKANFGHDVYCGDISNLEEIPFHADFVLGGPPCQGFSPLGDMSSSEARKNEQVQLNRLWREFLRVVEQVDPFGFVIENVLEFLKSRQFEFLKAKLETTEYRMTSGVLNAYEFGVPQKRRRGFVVALKSAFPALPAPTKEWTTVRDAIGNLPKEPTGENWHIGRNPTRKSLERYKCIPPGGNRFDLMKKRPDITPRSWLNKPTGTTDVFGRLEWDKPALTIRTEFFKPEKGRYLHPEAHRALTLREGARLQTFPDDFKFVGSKIEVARMIGNAVPPRLAYRIALAVKKQYEQAIGREQTVAETY